jgi:predicted RNase H-like nuclease
VDEAVTFIGIDLAWSPRNRSGAAVLRGFATGATLVDFAVLGTDAAIVAYIERHAGAGPAIVAVDAPLCVPNETGRRACETELQRVFGRYQAGPHPANRGLLAFDGVVRGEALVAALAAHGFTCSAAIEAGEPARRVVEVFPHPATIALFGLPRTLKYKKASQPARRAEALADWRRYQHCLRSLASADPPLAGHERFLAEDVAALRGRALKGYEDRADALLCAYVALYALRWGTARCRAFGDLASGAVFTPVPPDLWPASV